MRTACCLLVLIIGCGDDVAGDVDASDEEMCARTCDDGTFCNGAERCAPGAAEADADGCVAGANPCATVCNEATDSCADDCPNPDADGDGELSIECGGADCDDDDPSRFPGNVEICDTEGLDQDCDPNTLGDDGDEDGFVDDDCCNGATCGTDCDDDRAGVNPGAVDGCGGGDEDCDGDIDEEPDSVFFRDQDDDNYGDDDDTLAACAQPPGYTTRGGDCDDDPFVNPASNEVNPGVTEICNLVDDDCDMMIDEGLACDCSMPGTERACGFDPALDGVGICRLGTQTCRPEGTYTTCAGATPPMAEVCNLQDDDCDGDVDEDSFVTCYDDPDGDGYAAVGAGSSQECSCPVGSTSTDPAIDADCVEGNDDIHPGATEICNRIDDDCSSGGGVLVLEDRDNDGHTASEYRGCTAGFPRDDCNDFDNRVHPGQSTYFGLASCPSDQCPCGSGCKPKPNPFAVCTACAPGENGSEPGDYDFNCDGRTTRQPSRSSCGLCPTGFGCAGNSPSYGGAPVCGSVVPFIRCGSGACGSCVISGPTSDRLPCR